MRTGAERIVEGTVRGGQRCAGVDVAGRAEPLGDGCERHGFGEALAVTEFEWSHFFTS